MTSFVTIDTNILVKAFNESEPDYVEVIYAFPAIGMVCHDNSPVSTVSTEYQREVGNSKSFHKWYKRLVQAQAIHYCNGRLEQRHKDRLSKLQCAEPSDHIFIAVSYHSGRILITEDSDMGKGPKGHIFPHCDALDYLEKKMGLTVYDICEAANLLT